MQCHQRGAVQALLFASWDTSSYLLQFSSQLAKLKSQIIKNK